ncbi:hypothetical protein BOW51_01940 [Solemya velesiana gill symbiont]|uniref:histidine kinase n=1 Tax=Solemya velesiana gill symbiont TaxID=1918948 RepID=A0A1T2KXR8_9GAMM|nr:hypothetical protein BOW51_01940 [Solemya velesiana gill symbiont]
MTYQAAMILGVAFLFVYVYYEHESKNIYADEARQLKLAALGAAASMNTVYSLSAHQLSALANSPELVKYKATLAADELERMFAGSQQFVALSLLNFHGLETVGVAKGQPVTVFRNFSDVRVFQQANNTPNKVWFGLRDNWDGLDGPVFVGACRHVDMFDNDLGTLVAVKPLSEIITLLNGVPLPEGASLLLLDAGDVPVLHHKPGRDFAEKGKGGNVEVYWHRSLTGKTHFPEQLRVSGEPGYGARSVVGESGWSVIAFLPEVEMEGRFASMFEWLVPATLIWCIWGIAMMLVITRYFTKPLGLLTSAVIGVSADKNLSRRISWDSRDEFGQLTLGFNKMFATLEQTNRELDIANERLEERGRARTEALSKSEKHLRALSNHLQTITEEEKSRLAREIHDELGGALTALKLDASWIRKSVGHKQAFVVEKTRSMDVLLDSAIASIRRIVTELRPTILDDLGLQPAIEWHASEFEKRSGIPCNLRIDLKYEISDSLVKIAVFRVIQEALTNVLRHANAGRVDVIIKQQAGFMRVLIRDNGIGISEEDVNHFQSHGVRVMSERIATLDGEFRIRGFKGIGTVIRISLPLRDAPE